MLSFLWCAVLLVVPVLAQTQPPPQIQAQQLSQPSLAAAIYVADSPSTAHPLVGAKAFITAVAPGSEWIGPQYADPYGRFAFYNLPPGEYLLRVFNTDGRRVWQQTVDLPAVIPRIVVRTGTP